MRAAVSPRSHALLAALAGLSEGAHVAEALAEALRVKGDHARAGGQVLGHLGYLLIGDGAHRAEGLGHDQIGESAASAARSSS